MKLRFLFEGWAHDVLGVPEDASEDEIKRAYRREALKHHPDKNPGDPDAGERFKKVGAAYENLMKGGGDWARPRGGQTRRGPHQDWYGQWQAERERREQEQWRRWERESAERRRRERERADERAREPEWAQYASPPPHAHRRGPGLERLAEFLMALYDVEILISFGAVAVVYQYIIGSSVPSGHMGRVGGMVKMRLIKQGRKRAASVICKSDGTYSDKDPVRAPYAPAPGLFNSSAALKAFQAWESREYSINQDSVLDFDGDFADMNE